MASTGIIVWAKVYVKVSQLILHDSGQHVCVSINILSETHQALDNSGGKDGLYLKSR